MIVKILLKMLLNITKNVTNFGRHAFSPLCFYNTTVWSILPGAAATPHNIGFPFFMIGVFIQWTF